METKSPAVTETITDKQKVTNHLSGYVYQENAVISTGGEFRITNSYEVDTVPVENKSMYNTLYMTSISVYVPKEFSINLFDSDRAYGMTLYIRDATERITCHNATMSAMTVTDDVKRGSMWLTDTSFESLGRVIEYEFSCNTRDITVEKLSTS